MWSTGAAGKPSLNRANELYVIDPKPGDLFRASLGRETGGGRALNWIGGHKAYRTISNSEYRQRMSGSQTA